MLDETTVTHYIVHLALALRFDSYATNRLPWAPFGDVVAWTDENASAWLVKLWGPSSLAEK